MPLMRCTSNGKSGWKFGKSGKCYTGPGAKKKAAKQGAAIKSQGKRSIVEQVREHLANKEGQT